MMTTELRLTWHSQKKLVQFFQENESFRRAKWTSKTEPLTTKDEDDVSNHIDFTVISYIIRGFAIQTVTLEPLNQPPWS